jgi:hypothetical protein
MLRTQFVVLEHEGVWKIKFEGRHYGPYGTRRDALRAAIDAAHDAAVRRGVGGYSPRVMVETRNQLQTEWTAGQDPYPPHL